MKKLMLAGAMLCTSISAFANGVAVTPDANDPIITKFAELGVTVKQINPSPVTGLKELITNKGVLYASPDGQYLMQGTLIDLNNRNNLTEQALNGVRVEGLKEYEESMIVYKAPNEKHSITVFTDISCGYCRKLHRELDDLLDAGITVKYLAFPRGGLQGSGYADLMNVWCARDQQEALTEAKSGTSTKVVAGCSAPVAEHYQLGQSFGISGTPAIILEDGTMIPGYQPAAALKAALEANKAS
ncbi:MULTISPECIES: bifunctional protein-disulfide isomerase/oxidoreductase DsbC [Pseudoalteromonas]|jgi:thiol:disulfide interchange protein DsbC|uniref:Thiol:disulfide interchange protein n=3 Tax=Pseudoalteromonas TaxID=53246 RepID=A0AAP6Y2S8_9GAMM|nr:MULTISPECIES: bifunctional protein-disulfide isomerase/oxidoreductase DsbC [Pseudoalteromonas]ATC87729.1 thiol:disulfide interchange protein DsbC [Pseudoalteromonas arctica A 37-1-2]MBG9991366.1 bifunctional protein-disulfide isomerase/oxidoreductase DsbC [Pseudoalteromonas sp. NZS37]MBH0002695.1 bifunctional protein-disulfide isomerase/oxidoreductase DsbC [Pseudoalteromonas sp. SWYJZ12]MBH0013519.1 bifunctional protein-disulfide isomerase/oxidoreductase DsbC [Pseudoalteromonas sp. NZS100_1]